MVRVLFVLLYVLFDNFVCDVPRTEGCIPNGPKMLTPVSFTQVRKLLLNLARGSTLQPFDHITY